MSVVTCHI